jgi:hypothetical protein
MNKPNAKLWVWHKHGWVKLKLKPDEGVSLYDCGETDEGFFRYQDNFYYDSNLNRIDNFYHRFESDCDGRHNYSVRRYCSVSQLRSIVADEAWDSKPVRAVDGRYNSGMQDFEVMYPCPPRPEWQDSRSWQRDYFAEAMGY